MKRLLLIICMISALASCQNADPDPEPIIDPVEPENIRSALILNQGNWNSNDASLSLHNFASYRTKTDFFQMANGVTLGDLAEDIIVFGNKAYISVSNSGVIFVIDKSSLKILGKIRFCEEGGYALSPRKFTTYGKDVYVSYYEGYVGQIDTSSLELKNLVKVGRNPEGLAASGGKLYVANSGGLSYPDYDNTVSVIDCSSFKLVSTIDVVENPCDVVADSEGDIYVVSCGNYSDIPSKLQKIKTSTGQVTTFDEVDAPTKVAAGSGNTLVIITNAGDILRFDASSSAERLVGNFVTGDTKVENPYSVSSDPSSGYVFIGTSDYVTTGRVYLFTIDGVFCETFSCDGLNPQKVVLSN